jgi:hypothetical protein
MGAVMSDINALLNKLDKVRPVGEGKWVALCPAHADKRPSLAIKLTGDDKILLHCWCGCDVQSIVAAIGLTLSDLMPERPDGYDRPRAKAPRFNKYELFDTVVHSSMVLSLAVRHLLDGKALSDVDLQAVVKAENLINELEREVRP